MVEKKELRNEMKRRLAAMDHEQIFRWSRAACRHAAQADWFRRARMVMLFLSMPQEIDTTDVIHEAWTKGKRVVVPRIDRKQRTMKAVEIHNMDEEMEMDGQGLRNPVRNEPVPEEEIDLIVAPGLAFDRKGHRLGRGAGYYDRFLSQPNLRAGVCGFGFTFQVVDSLPTERHDRTMDWIVTEELIITCSH
jgi:5-formyltetrahydrofolate cyclo-ligase